MFCAASNHRCTAYNMKQKKVDANRMHTNKIAFELNWIELEVAVKEKQRHAISLIGWAEPQKWMFNERKSKKKKNWERQRINEPADPIKDIKWEKQNTLNTAMTFKWVFFSNIISPSFFKHLQNRMSGTTKSESESNCAIYWAFIYIYLHLRTFISYKIEFWPFVTTIYVLFAEYILLC